MVIERSPDHGAEDLIPRTSSREAGQEEKELENVDPRAHRVLPRVQGLLGNRRAEDHHDEPEEHQEQLARKCEHRVLWIDDGHKGRDEARRECVASAREEDQIPRHGDAASLRYRAGGPGAIRRQRTHQGL